MVCFLDSFTFQISFYSSGEEALLSDTALGWWQPGADWLCEIPQGS